MGYPHKRYPILLLFTEGHTVGALVHAGICLVGAHQDSIQGAEVCAFAVVSTLGNSALDALVGIAVHLLFLLFL